MNPLRALRQLFGNISRAVQLLEEIREGIANLADVADRTRAEGEATRMGIANLTEVLNQRLLEMSLNTDSSRSVQLLQEIREGIANLSGVPNQSDSEKETGIGGKLASVRFVGSSADRSQDLRANEKELPVTGIGGLRFEKSKL